MTVSAPDTSSPDTEARKRVAGLLARASREELTGAWDALTTKPDYTPVRGPETGLVMVRGDD